MGFDTSFIDLPQSIRFKIYHFCGIVRPCPIDLRAEGRQLKRRRELETKRIQQGWTAAHREDELEKSCLYRIRARGDTPNDNSVRLASDCICPPLPTQLLYVSRLFHDEIVPLILGLNRFRVYYRNDYYSFSLLWRLSDKALACMRALHVRLNFWPCPRGHDDHPDHPCGLCRAQESDEPPVSVETDSGEKLLRGWQILCRRLSTRLTPGVLAFSFIADAQDLPTAKILCKALKRLPKLKECAIRLGRTPSHDINRLARKTAVKMLSGTQRVSSRFIPYSRLPKEIKLLILSYTNLTLLHSHASTFEENERINVMNSKIFHSGWCCERCTSSYEQCCCPWKRAAFSATCTCRRIPSSLLSMSREMRQDAYEVLLSSNCISFSQGPRKTLNYLMALPSFTLKYYRHIQFLWENSEHITPWFEAGLDLEWRELVQYMKTHLNLSNLRITVNCRDCHDVGLSSLSIDETRYIFDTYVNMFSTLRALQGLKSFHVYLGWFRGLEVISEHAVMSPLYDSFADGKHRCEYHENDASCRSWDIPWEVPLLASFQSLEETTCSTS